MNTVLVPRGCRCPRCVCDACLNVCADMLCANVYTMSMDVCAKYTYVDVCITNDYCYKCLHDWEAFVKLCV